MDENSSHGDEGCKLDENSIDKCLCDDRQWNGLVLTERLYMAILLIIHREQIGEHVSGTQI